MKAKYKTETRKVKRIKDKGIIQKVSRAGHFG